MRSLTTAEFRELLAGAPEAIQAKARIAYRIWAENAAHPSLRFKKVHSTLPIFSVRIDRDWRALGVLRSDTMIWFWIGSHEDYERLLKRF